MCELFLRCSSCEIKNFFLHDFGRAVLVGAFPVFSPFMLLRISPLKSTVRYFYFPFFLPSYLLSSFFPCILTSFHHPKFVKNILYVIILLKTASANELYVYNNLKNYL